MLPNGGDMTETICRKSRCRPTVRPTGLLVGLLFVGLIVFGSAVKAQPVGTEPIPAAMPFEREFVCKARDEFRIQWQALEKDVGQLTGTLRFKRLRKSKIGVPAALLQLRSADTRDFMGIELAKYFSDIDEIGISLHRTDENGQRVMIPTGMAVRKGDTVPFAMAWKRNEWLAVRINKDQGWHNGALNFAATGVFLSCVAATVEFLDLSIEEFEDSPRRWRDGFDDQPEKRQEPGPGEEPEDDFRRDDPIFNPTVTGMTHSRS